MPIANKTSPEYRYSEIVLHYSDGAKSVVSATGRDPRCSREVSIRQHASSGSTTAFGYPYKATWTQLRYTLPPSSESSCVRDEDMVNEKVEVMHIEVLPSDASASTTLASNSHEMTFDAQPVVAEDPETAEFLGEEDNILIRRRATFGELCQLLVLFTILGLLHYVSMRWAARWHAPRADAERRIPQCEQQLT
ncbi:hypothetical protein FS749_002160 [Ceratobasidium sp. UAMH 11750]|nr:hypothetical protein FS749_002160 [Ceratobasidium sp. UAMH 11750]